MCISFAFPLTCHKDHIKSLPKFKKYCFECYTPDNIEDGKLIETNFWKILPMKLIHNVTCFGFIIYSKIENKKIVYMTDTTYIPKINWQNIDCWIQDTNFSKEIVDEFLEQGKQVNIGYMNHCSVEKVAEYIKMNNFRPKNFVAFHLSNSQLITIDKIKEKLEPLVENLIISSPNTEINF